MTLNFQREFFGTSSYGILTHLGFQNLESKYGYDRGVLGLRFQKKRHSATFRPIALKLIERGVNILEPAFYYIVSERSDKVWLSAIFFYGISKTQILRYAF